MTSYTVSGSEAGAVCGLDPYRSPIQVWAEKTGLTEPREAGEAALWGTLLEPLIVAQVEAREYVTMPAVEIVGPEPWMISHPDGYCAIGRLAQLEEPRDVAPDDAGSSPAPPSSRGVLEVKTAGAWVKGWDDDSVPPAYLAQVHHYMAATKLEWALLACLIGGQRLELRTIERDDSFLALLLEAEQEFVGYCEKGTPPPPDGTDATDEILRRLYPTAATGEIVELTADDMLVLGELRALKEAAKETERQVKEREQVLKLRLGDAELGVFGGKPEVRWQTISRKGYEVQAATYRRFTA